MDHIQVSLHLVNRTLRQAGYHEALPREETVIRILAEEGLSVRVITGKILTSRRERALIPAE